MKFAQDQSEIKYKNSFKAGGYKPHKKVVKPTKPTVKSVNVKNDCYFLLI